MPNPKTGTVTQDIAKAVNEIKGGKIEFRVDRHSNLHFIIGKASFDEKALAENYAAALDEVLRLKPSSSKGSLHQEDRLSTTMGPGIPVDRPQLQRCRRRASLTHRQTSQRPRLALHRTGAVGTLRDPRPSAPALMPVPFTLNQRPLVVSPRKVIGTEGSASERPVQVRFTPWVEVSDLVHDTPRALLRRGVLLLGDRARTEGGPWPGLTSRQPLPSWRTSSVPATRWC